jgi:signal transduction histidine kinase
MRILHTLRQGLRACLSPRLWILGILLFVLCTLAVLQFRWIDRVTQAERERSKRSLIAAVSNLERDFDIEITRVLATFEFPALNASEYTERYQEWLRRSPYPGVIRGVYILDTRKPGDAPKQVIPGEPPIHSTDWERQVSELALPLQITTATPLSLVRRTSPPKAEQGIFVRSFGFPGPSLLVDGNPAFLFPIMPAPPGGVTPTATRIIGSPPAALELSLRMTSASGPIPSEWAVIVLDAHYLRSTLLPNLLKTHFPNTSSEYDLLVVNKKGSDPQHILFQSSSAPPEEKFLHADGATGLFLLRPDCFAPTLTTEGVAVAPTRVLQFGPGSKTSAAYATRMGVVGISAEGRLLPDPDRLSEILRRQPQSCSDAPAALLTDFAAPWELLVQYRAGSLDQAMATFRRNNLLWSGGVLSVLALGICMLVVLTERARSLAEMQSEFVLGVSHELRTPLTVIRVAADNLRKGVAGDVHQVHRYGDIIAAQAVELSDMIEETLVFARVQSVSPIGKRTSVSLEEIVKSALAKCDSVLRSAEIDLEVQIAPRLPLIKGDVRLLDKCLQNLIQNVVKYAAAGKWMAIRADQIVVSEGERVRLSVQDRGPGISPEDLPHIFEPFYRGKASQTPGVPGLGLGLTFVKRVVEAHLGRIEVSSSNRGSSLFLLLPPFCERKEPKEA